MIPIHHASLRLLEVNGISLRDIFQNMETRLRNGSRHADAHAVAEGAADDFFAASSLPNVAAAMPAIRELINRILRDTVDTWARAHTLGGLADALSGLCDTLLVYGSGNDESGAGNGKADIWSRFPIDAECLFRLMQRVIPALKDNGMADTPLPWPLMQAMLLELVRAERVPFEADRPALGKRSAGAGTRLLRFAGVPRGRHRRQASRRADPQPAPAGQPARPSRPARHPQPRAARGLHLPPAHRRGR